MKAWVPMPNIPPRGLLSQGIPVLLKMIIYVDEDLH